MRFSWPAAALAAALGPLAAAQVQHLPHAGSLDAVPIELRWSDRRAWPNHTLPAAGDCVVIPAGKNFVLDVSPPPLAGLDIAGSLRFDDQSDLELRADWIRVTGKLEIGTEAQPFAHRATITLADDFTAVCDPNAIERALAVEGTGVLELHGAPHSATWTHLAATANAGDTLITLQDPVDWRAGDVIVIAPTNYYQHVAELDQRTIVDVQGTQIQVDHPLDYTHWSATEGASYDGVGVEERGEVGLLSHNVVIQGDPVLLPSGKMSGGQTRLHDAGATPPSAHIEWAEFRALGDEEVLGHYPLHFHQIGDLSGSYVRHSSIHHCFNRWISIHTSQNLDVEDNVACDTIGHGYYFEDEGAHGCTMRHNLGILARSVETGTGLNGDDKPSVFWLVNPDNVIEDNAAVGAGFAGFWFDTADNETIPWAQFERNVAHSNGDTGFYGNNKPTPSPGSELRHCLAFKNRNYGYWIRALESMKLIDCDSADNRGGYYLAASGFQVDPLARDGIGHVALIDSLVIGVTNNSVGFPQQTPNALCLGYARWDALAGVELYDGLVTVEHCTFANFVDTPAPGGVIRKAGAFTPTWYASPWAIDPRNAALDCTFVNDGVTQTNPIWLRQPTGTFVKCNGTLKGDNGVASTILFDSTGSFGGVAGNYVVPNNPFLMPSVAGNYVPAWNAWVIDGPPSNVYGQLDLNTIVPDQVAADLLLQGVTLPDVIAKTMRVDSLARGVGFTIVAPKETQNQTPGAFQPRYPTNVLANEQYVYTYDPLVTSDTWGRWFQLSFLDARPGDFAIASVPLLGPSANGVLQVLINGVDLSAAPAPDLATLLASTGQGWWYDATNAQMWLRLELDSLTGGTSIYDSASTTATVLSY